MDENINERIRFFEEFFKSDIIHKKNGSDLLSLSIKFSKIESYYNEINRSSLLKKKIALLSSVTTHHFKNVLIF